MILSKCGDILQWFVVAKFIIDTVLVIMIFISGLLNGTIITCAKEMVSGNCM